MAEHDNDPPHPAAKKAAEIAAKWKARMGASDLSQPEDVAQFYAILPEIQGMGEAELFVRGVASSLIGAILPGKRGKAASLRGTAMNYHWITRSAMIGAKVSAEHADSVRFLNDELERHGLPIRVRLDDEDVIFEVTDD